MGFKVESVAPVSPRIWPSFSLIFISVSLWPGKGITGSSLPEKSLGANQLREDPGDLSRAGIRVSGHVVSSEWKDNLDRGFLK